MSKQLVKPRIIAEIDGDDGKVERYEYGHPNDRGWCYARHSSSRDGGLSWVLGTSMFFVVHPCPDLTFQKKAVEPERKADSDPTVGEKYNKGSPASPAGV